MPNAVARGPKKPSSSAKWTGTHGVCPICEQERPLVQDHDHATGLVRGRLCRSCNSRIGRLGSEPNKRFAGGPNWANQPRKKKRIREYLVWWQEHPSEKGYTGFGWVNGRYSVSWARAHYGRVAQYLLKASMRAHPEWYEEHPGAATSDEQQGLSRRWVEGCVEDDLKRLKMPPIP
jgi:hypothetical protein